MKNQMKHGLSLISLIITIIVIIILAVIIIFSGLNTPDRANFARFVEDFSSYHTAITNDFMNKKAKYSLEEKTRTDEQIYDIIATGNESIVDVNEEPIATGLIADLNLNLHPEFFQGTKYFEITSDSNIEGINHEKQFFSTTEKHYITDKGEVFFLPGYLLEENGTAKWFINENQYYESDDGASVFNSTGVSALSREYHIGDYVEYSPKEEAKYTPSEEKTGTNNEELKTDMSATWRVIDIDATAGKLYITPGIVNTSEKVYFNWLTGYFHCEEELNNICKTLYSNEDKGIIAKSMDVNEFNRICQYNENVTRGYVYYKNSSECEEGDEITKDGVTYTCTVSAVIRRFFTGINGKTKNFEGIPYQSPTVGNPVYVKQTSYQYHYPNAMIKEIINHQGVDGWLATTCVHPKESVAEYCTFVLDADGVNYHLLSDSSSWQERSQGGMIPIICIEEAKLSGEGTGAKVSPWKLR